MKNSIKTITVLFLTIFAMSCSKDDDKDDGPKTEEFLYSNGNLSTGATAADGTAAPAGYTWSQSHPTNTNTGYSVNDNFSIADDFIIAPNEKWDIKKISFYAYKTNHTAAETPFNNVRFEIYNTNPSGIGATKIFGDLTTNKFVSSQDAKMYRITSSTGGTGTTRRIYKITADVSGLVLTPGIYWIRWQTGTTDNSLHYHPAVVVSGSAGLPTFNAINFDGTIWAFIKDTPSMNTVDFPFEVGGVKTIIKL